MRLNILIGGKAGQGINKVSEIVAKVATNYGYFTFNYRDYQSLIRGGHNFNVLCISDKWIASTDSEMDVIVALDNKTIELHKKELKKDGIVIESEGFENYERNLNVALAGALIKILGIDKKILLDKVKKEFNSIESLKAAEKGYESQNEKFGLKKLNNKSVTMTGNSGIVKGAVESGIELYFSYPMTPATGVMHELASIEKEKCDFIVVQPENEIAVINMGLGASYTGKKVMIGTSGGGYDLMTEALSLSGQAEIPIVIYLASRPGPSTGVPTYSSQDDLNVALRAGHGEFARLVVAPGDPVECIENTNESFYLSEKLKIPTIVLSDKHLAEGEYSINKKSNNTLKVEVKRTLPGAGKIVKASSYEHDKFGFSVEEPELVKKGVEARLKVYEDLKKECKKFDMIKVHGKKDSKNLIVSWGSTKGAILDAISDLDCKFLQVLYMKPMSDKIKEEIQKAKKVILIENSSAGQLGRLIREKTGIKIEKRILKYDGRPFFADELKKEIVKELK
ncbi:MAG TPA: 2-oxoacid:acceptor oxidoreductase family protein [Candidatus Paceibacterota bacterium]|nr:2-oxoacid:acceptor oxidoreductase family protein [Candidatus Paceibacterota bacterium]